MPFPRKEGLPCTPTPLPPFKLESPVSSLYLHLIEPTLCELLYLCPYLSSASPHGNHELQQSRACALFCSGLQTQSLAHSRCLSIWGTSEWMKGHCWCCTLLALHWKREKKDLVHGQNSSGYIFKKTNARFTQ